MIAPDLTVPIPDEIRAVHFIGIGGSGISGLARMFLGAGIPVSGSDRAESQNTGDLVELGATVHIGHDAANLGDVDTVVYTGAIWPENPEFLAAKERGLSVLHRSQALKYLIAGRRLVSVAGAHGKTTSTGMIVTALAELGDDPSFVNGGVIQQYGVSSRAGSDDLFVVEADESDGTFLIYDTSIALITNVDADHLDHYGSHEAFDDAFVRFADSAREAVVISSDDAGASRVAARLTHRNVVSFGEAADADVRVEFADDGSVRVSRGEESAELCLAVPGRHNVLNAAGAIAVMTELGHPFPDAVRAASAFGGTVRRFELHGTRRGVSVYDDYAHHPTEVRAVLSAARDKVAARAAADGVAGRVIAVFQPHLYSRTITFAEEFAESLSLADTAVVLDIYGAREDPVEGVTSRIITDRMTVPVVYEERFSDVPERVAEVARPGDVVLTVGAGTVTMLADEILRRLGGEA